MSKFSEEVQDNSEADQHSENLRKEVSQIEAKIRTISAARHSIGDTSTIYLMLKGIQIPQEFASEIDMASLIISAGDTNLLEIYQNAVDMAVEAGKSSKDSSEENIFNNMDVNFGGRINELAKLFEAMMEEYLQHCYDNDIAPDINHLNTLIDGIQKENKSDLEQGLNNGNEVAHGLNNSFNDIKGLGDSGIDHDKFRENFSKKSEGKQNIDFSDCFSALMSSSKGESNKVGISINENKHTIELSDVSPEQMEQIKKMLSKDMAKDNGSNNNSSVPDARDKDNSRQP